MELGKRNNAADSVSAISCARKPNLFRLAVLVFLLTAGTGNISAQVYSQYIYGYFPTIFMTGSNLFNNPLQSGNNGLSQLFSAAGRYAPPTGTTVSLWNPTNSSFDTTSVFTNGAWSVDLILPPGTGALVFAPSRFTNTIGGYVLNHDGSPLTNDLNSPPPPLFSAPPGIYLLGDKFFASDTGTNIFINLVGRLPFVGEQVASLTNTCTYLGGGAWDTVPVLGISQAAFLTLQSAPAIWLTIIYTNGQAVVSWPASAAGWTLQTNNNLTTGVWGNYTGAVINNTATNPTPTDNLFYRLSYQ